MTRLLLGLLLLTTMCKSQTTEEKIKQTVSETISALQNGDTKKFIALIGRDLKTKNEETINYDVKQIQRLLHENYNNSTPQPEFPDLYNFLGQRVIRIPLNNKPSDFPSVKEMHLNLYIGPPNFVSLRKLSGYELIRNNSDSAEFRPLSHWKKAGIAR